MNNNAVIAVAVAALLVAGGGAAAYFMMNDGGKGSDAPELIVGQYTYDAYDHASGKNVKMPAFYEDSYFDKGASADNPSLMMFAFNIAMSCGYSTDDFSRRSDSVVAFMTAVGYTETYVNDAYKTEPTMHSTQVALGSRTIGSYTVIIVAVNGMNYGAAFGSNMLVGASGDHEGFSEGKDVVLETLRHYIEDKGITGDVKLLTTGYSRSAAITNLVGRDVSDAIAEGTVAETVGDVNLEKDSAYFY
ncbi:MAG: hypothetical protein J6O90_01000, partial [Candidatus Methanomethylophilaceae archaeon]|nr:hypothetical protein [Candidatus Methanomethylophilaceae archaeon]